MKKFYSGRSKSQRASSSDASDDEEWELLQYDVDNWLEVPEFDADPKSLEFKGFAFPVAIPGQPDFGLKRIAYQNLKSARWAMRHMKMKKSEQKDLLISSLDVMGRVYADDDGVEFSIRQSAASMYEAVVFSLGRLNSGLSQKPTADEKLQYLSDAGKFLHQLTMTAVRDPSTIEALKKKWEMQQEQEKKAKLSRNGAKGLDVRHKPTRDLNKWVVEEARSMTGSATWIASRLYLRIPESLQLPDKPVERVETMMANAIRADRKKLRLAGKP